MPTRRSWSRAPAPPDSDVPMPEHDRDEKRRMKLPAFLLSTHKAYASVTGLAGPQPVRILAVERLTDDSANVLYRTDAGPAERIVFASQSQHIRAVDAGLAFSFDASPSAFLLAAEARRMRLAYLFDSQAALGTSAVEPLPHQLRAVYEIMLQKQPLRYVLADDPGPARPSWQAF
jgi:hypothetical protein